MTSDTKYCCSDHTQVSEAFCIYYYSYNLVCCILQGGSVLPSTLCCNLRTFRFLLLIINYMNKYWNIQRVLLEYWNIRCILLEYTAYTIAILEYTAYTIGILCSTGVLKYWNIQRILLEYCVLLEYWKIVYYWNIGI